MHIKPALSILKVLAYFDIFNYPLSKEEIFFFLDQKMHPDKVDVALQQLVTCERIFMLGDFYSLRNDNFLRDRRIAGNTKALQVLKKAYDIGAFLYRFPYVRGIGISGSLSKNFADDT